MRGAGDLIKSVTERLGIKQCEGCQKRQQALNRLISFYPKLTESQVLIYNKLINEGDLSQWKTLYQDVYKRKVNCTKCSAHSIIEKLTISYELSR